MWACPHRSTACMSVCYQLGSRALSIREQSVDNVDHALANCPHCPHACARLFGVGELWTMWAMWTPLFLLAAYNIVYSYCIHFDNFLIHLSNSPHCPQTPLFIGRACGQFPAFFPIHKTPTLSTFCKLIVYIGFCLQHVSDWFTSTFQKLARFSYAI